MWQIEEGKQHIYICAVTSYSRYQVKNYLQEEAKQSFSQLLTQLKDQKCDLVFYYPAKYASLIIQLLELLHMDNFVDDATFNLPLVVLQESLMKHMGPNWSKGRLLREIKRLGHGKREVILQTLLYQFPKDLVKLLSEYMCPCMNPECGTYCDLVSNKESYVTFGVFLDNAYHIEATNCIEAAEAFATSIFFSSKKWDVFLSFCLGRLQKWEDGKWNDVDSKLGLNENHLLDLSRKKSTLLMISGKDLRNTIPSQTFLHWRQTLAFVSWFIFLEHFTGVLADYRSIGDIMFGTMHSLKCIAYDAGWIKEYPGLRDVRDNRWRWEEDDILALKSATCSNKEWQVASWFFKRIL
jgi:hypothetical protein